MLRDRHHLQAIRSRFTNGVSEWIDYRLPIFTLLRRELNEYPTPRNLTYLWNFGSLSGIVLVIMIVTRIALAMHYTPTTAGAFDSIEWGQMSFLVVYAWFVFYEPGALLNPDNSIPANPAVTPSHIVPEWYLLPYYAILRAIPNKLLGVLAMFGSIFILFLLPSLDRSPVRSARFRPVFRPFFWLLVRRLRAAHLRWGPAARGDVV